MQRGLAPILILFFLTLTGCKTWGGYGNQELIVRQMAIANETFEADLRQAERLLVSRGATDAAPSERVRGLEALVAVHETMLDHHMELARRAADEQEHYRFLKRAFGAIVIEQKAVRDRYQNLFSGYKPLVDSSYAIAGDVLPQTRYVVVPPYYQRVMSRAGFPTAAGWSGEAGQSASESVAPDTVAASSGN